MKLFGRMFPILGISMFIFAAVASAADKTNIGPYEISVFDPAAYSQTPTECDELAAHREDPHKVAPGKGQSGITDFPAAIEACMAAVDADPENPRLNYQLGRLLGYSERGDEAMPYHIAALEAGYPQSLFVIGYIYVIGANIEQDVCLGAELIRHSAFAGRFAGQVAFPNYVLSGEFDNCPVKKEKDDMLNMLTLGESNAEGFYEEMLVSILKKLVADQ